MSPLPPDQPGLPSREAVLAEAHGVLLEKLQRQDCAHALQRLARAITHLSGLPCRLRVVAGQTAVASFDAGHAAGHTLVDVEPLCFAGQLQGWLCLPAEGSSRSLLDALQPLIDTAGSMMAVWLQESDAGPPPSLTLIRQAMREGGSFVWEWDIPTDVLGDIDEGALILGYEVGEIGHTQVDWNRLIHPDDLDKVEAAYEAHANGEAPFYRAIYRALAANGDWRWVEERGRVVERNAHGEPLYMVGTQTDATAQVALAEAQRERLAAEAASAAKTRFLSRVSHELRTPMNAVLGFTQLLQMDPDRRLDTTQHQHLALVRQAGDYLLGIISDLLDLSLVEGEKLSLQAAPVALLPLVQDCIAMVRSQAEAAQVRLTVSMPDGPAATTAQVLADRKRLQQALINLLTNAIKYNRVDGEVRVVLQADQAAAWQVQVHDTGQGIAPQQMPFLFEPFNRLGQAHGPVSGAGLGLALAQALALSMGGHITARSEHGQGSVFTLTVPSAPLAG